jgi:3',5'-cyclic AMP phosphodiesterase CpdA
VLVGAGDIADCGSPTDVATAKLVEAIPGTVFTAGDDAYEAGTGAEFAKCYGPTWGRFRDRTRPAIGNHDAATADGAAYFAYFGAAAGDPIDGWYSYQAGTWHVIVLNANCPGPGGCGSGSRQLAWLQADLAAHPGGCTVAIWHQPRFSSGEHGDDRHSAAFWAALYAAGADLIVNGHDHDYERFAPQDSFGAFDPVKGIREIVVGTGGKSLRVFRPTIVPTSEVRNSRTYGVLRLDLAPGRYSWQFLPIAGQTFTDRGSDVCH